MFPWLNFRPTARRPPAESSLCDPRSDCDATCDGAHQAEPSGRLAAERWCRRAVHRGAHVWAIRSEADRGEEESRERDRFLPEQMSDVKDD